MSISILIIGIQVSDLQTYFQYGSEHGGIYMIPLLLVWRARLAMVLSAWMPITEIQNIESMCWIASSFAKNSYIRRVAAHVATARTLGIEYDSIKYFSDEERSKYFTGASKQPCSIRIRRISNLYSPTRIKNSSHERIKSRKYFIS